MILLKVNLQKLAIITTEVETGLFCNSEYNSTSKKSWSRFNKVV